MVSSAQCVSFVAFPPRRAWNQSFSMVINPRSALLLLNAHPDVALIQRLGRVVFTNPGPCLCGTICNARPPLMLASQRTSMSSGLDG